MPTDRDRGHEPEHGLARYADDLGDPADYFASDDPARSVVLVVRHDTGAPEFVVRADGGLAPYAGPETPPGPGVRLSVVNPPGFAGFPRHDPADPRYDLARLIPDPDLRDDYFLSFEAEHPLVVRHDTGMPVGRVKGEGEGEGAGAEIVDLDA